MCTLNVSLKSEIFFPSPPYSNCRLVPEVDCSGLHWVCSYLAESSEGVLELDQLLNTQSYAPGNWDPQPKSENGGNPSLATISHSILVKATGQKRCSVQFSITTVGHSLSVSQESLTLFPRSNHQCVLRKSYLLLAILSIQLRNRWHDPLGKWT